MKFAAQIEFMKNNNAVIFLDGKVVSDIYLLEDYMIGVDYDIFNPNILESEAIKELPDGHYIAFLTGTLQLEEAGDPDVGMSEPSYIFLADDNDIDVYQLLIEKTTARAYQKRINRKEDKDVTAGRYQRGNAKPARGTETEEILPES